ncbi:MULTISPECIES: hypothetical protein [unclassified Aureimonas]|uniref:hypothetical protein n=1 Tax=unclassified Aureimonas TaxID=2615206 RepID=UPI00070110E2|nr:MULTISPECIES: hypothetical protein [unclassified Aureimonas]KQT52950.1 hypothetical protein ASG62_13655 [Aureimonas sp. Leaf427]KQT80409.1 hypothetical protein ASG54_07505 [Aureimonas sp. Leaf460]
MCKLLSGLVLSAAIASGASAPSFAADYYGAEPPAQVHAKALVPACEDARVLAQVEDQFEYGAAYMLKADLSINEFRDPFEKAYFPKDEDHQIERRYCQGEVVLSNLQKHTIYYVIAHPLGYASIGWKAEGCVLGLDKWYVYGANCQSLRRF